MESQELLECFFKAPDRKPDPKGDGILYHLRVDLEKLYGTEGEYEGDPPSYAILAMTGVLVGIEYLSQCYFSKKLSGTAFVESLMDLGGIDWDNAEALYQLRCALLHSFSLSIVSDRKSFRKGTLFSFRVMDDSPDSIIRMESATESEVYYKVNVWGLKLCFTRMISELQKICLDSTHKKHAEILERVCQRAACKILKK
ncbi:MAG TPA: hypothetical protein VMG30_20350 [Acidobacteriota bacterium]|nr:hypothetical protein [Acidobacteriota bacterium]